MSAHPEKQGWFVGISTQARILLAIVLVCAFVFPLLVLSARFPDAFTYLLEVYHEHFDIALPSARVYVDGVSLLLAVCLWGTFVQYRRARAREAALADVINSISPDVLIVLGPDGRVELCNRAVKRMLGYDEEEVRQGGSGFVVFAEASATSQPPPMSASFAEAEGFRVRSAEGRTKGGETVPLEVISGQLQGREGEVLLLRDITERRRAEQALLAAKEDLERRVVQRTAELIRANEGLKHEIHERKLAEEEGERLRDELLQAQKLEAIGLLAGGIAHDFNNLLTAIGGHLRLAMGLLPEDAEARQHLSFADRACTRAAELVRQLLQFSRRAPLTPAPIDLNGVLASLQGMLGTVLGERIELALELCAEPALVLGDATSLEQVLTNLLVNARDAMPHGGVIRVGTAQVTLTTEAARDMRGARPGRFLRLSVEDAGTGMPQEVLCRVFEPFFTTKKPGQGTGLGLAGAYGTVKQHDGWIEVWSEEGVGSRFSIYLPARAGTEVAEPGSPVSTAEPASRTGKHLGRTLLVVEDDESVRKLAALFLTQKGYTILQAGSVQSALAALGQHDAAIDLVFADVTLPDGTGIALADEVSRSWPGMRFLLTSGDASGRVPHEESGGPRLPFIRKPYDLDELAARLEDVLSAPAV